MYRTVRVHPVGEEDVQVEGLVKGVVLSDVPDLKAVRELEGALGPEDLHVEDFLVAVPRVR